MFELYLNSLIMYLQKCKMLFIYKIVNFVFYFNISKKLRTN